MLCFGLVACSSSQDVPGSDTIATIGNTVTDGGVLDDDIEAPAMTDEQLATELDDLLVEIENDGLDDSLTWDNLTFE